MPYIKQVGREGLTTRKRRPVGPGELNFVITTAITDYLATKPKLNYQAINDVLGALEGAKQEFYRRVAVPYENDAIARNGDVYCP
jgi:hypothetical protein